MQNAVEVCLLELSSITYLTKFWNNQFSWHVISCFISLSVTYNKYIFMILITYVFIERFLNELAVEL